VFHRTSGLCYFHVSLRNSCNFTKLKAPFFDYSAIFTDFTVCSKKIPFELVFLYYFQVVVPYSFYFYVL